MKSWHERCLQPCLFLCSIRQPFLRPDRALLLRRRAQTPSRSAVAQTTPQCPTSRGRTLDGGEHGGRLAWVGQKTIRRSGTAKLEPAMLSPPSQLCAHGCIVPSSRSGLLYNVREWERERPSNAVTAAPSNCVNGLRCPREVSGQQRGQGGLTHLKRLAAQIVTVQLDQVERIQNDVAVTATRVQFVE